MTQYQELTRDELIQALESLQKEQNNGGHPEGADQDRIVHDLQVHQIELEVQNRELRETQQLLEESRSRYADLFDLAPVGYVTLNDAGRVIEANLTAAALLGIARAALIGRLFTGFLPIRDRELMRNNVRRCLVEHCRVEAELTVSTKGRPDVVVHAVSTPWFEHDGQVTACKTTLSDITHLKRTETMFRFLAEASDSLAKSLDFSGTLSAVVHLCVPYLADVAFMDLLDESGTLARVASAAVDGQQERAVLMARSSSPSRGWTPQALAVRSGEAILAQIPDRRASGTYDVDLVEGACSLLVLPLTARRRSLGALTLVMAKSARHYTSSDRDLALEVARRAALALDNAQLYRAANVALRARDDILGIVSHDLRNPLNSIMLSTATLRAKLTKDASGEPAQIGVITRAVRRMDRLITDLVDASSIDQGRLAIQVAPFDVNELLQDSMDLLLPLAREKSLALDVQLLSPSMTVLCDRDRIIQVLSNLIGNAIKFTRNGGTISVQCEKTGADCRFSVSDNGPGIDPDLTDHVFERFWQAKEHARLGRGLGLYITRGIIEAHGGRVWVQSRTGEGARFVFTVPIQRALYDAQSESIDEEAPPSQVGIRQCVLVVDDDDDIRNALGTLLQMHGYRVVQAQNGLEALQQLAQLRPPPGLILLDLHMPVMDGREFMEHLRKDPALHSLPVILISGELDLRLHIQVTGAQGGLTKPVKPEDLLEKIRGFTSRSPAQAPSHP